MKLECTVYTVKALRCQPPPSISISITFPFLYLHLLWGAGEDKVTWSCKHSKNSGSQRGQRRGEGIALHTYTHHTQTHLDCSISPSVVLSLVQPRRVFSGRNSLNKLHLFSLVVGLWLTTAMDNYSPRKISRDEKQVKTLEFASFFLCKSIQLVRMKLGHYNNWTLIKQLHSFWKIQSTRKNVC